MARNYGGVGMEGEMSLPLHAHRAHHASAWKPGELLLTKCIVVELPSGSIRGRLFRRGCTKTTGFRAPNAETNALSKK